MSQERLQILKMLQEGKVSAEEAASLLEAIETEAVKPAVSKMSAQWLKIRVTDMKTGKSKVNVNLPIALLGIATRFVKVEHMGGVDLNEIIKLVREGAKGKIIDVTDEDEGVQVEIVIE